MGMKNFLGQVLGHEVLRKLFSGVGTFVQEEGTKALKSKVFGIGVTDEVLTWAAFEIAMNHPDMKVSTFDVIRIAKVLSSYPFSVKNKLTNMIGYDQQERKIETETGKGDKTIITRDQSVSNLRGAKFIKMLSEMSDDEIRIYLEGIDATTTLTDRVKEVFVHVPGMLTKIDQSDLRLKVSASRDRQKAKYLARKNRR